MKNSSAGYDNFDAKRIKSLKYEILKPLVHNFNLSFTQGKMPDNLKIAEVIPIYKTGDNPLFSNHRPLSVMFLFSKIIEREVYNRITSFLVKSNILYKYQFGFL